MRYNFMQFVKRRAAQLLVSEALSAAATIHRAGVTNEQKNA